MTEMDPTERSPKLPADGEEERSGYKPFGGSQRVPEERHEGIMRSRVFLLIIRNGPVWCREGAMETGPYIGAVDTLAEGRRRPMDPQAENRGKWRFAL